VHIFNGSAADRAHALLHHRDLHIPDIKNHTYKFTRV
jgi:hypothetical protein